MIAKLLRYPSGTATLAECLDSRGNGLPDFLGTGTVTALQCRHEQGIGPDGANTEVVHRRGRSPRCGSAGEALLAPSITRRLVEDFCRRPAPDGAAANATSQLTGRELDVVKPARRQGPRSALPLAGFRPLPLAGGAHGRWP